MELNQPERAFWQCVCGWTYHDKWYNEEGLEVTPVEDILIKHIDSPKIKIYGKTKHFTYFSQHEEGVIRQMVEFYLKHENFEWDEIMIYYKNTAKELLKEIEDSPCFCHTCTAYREGKLKI